jgi:hypothetical protein
MRVAIAVLLLLAFALTSCRSSQKLAVDDSAVIDAVMEFKQREALPRQLYKVFDMTSPRSADYAEGETDAPPDVVDMLRRRNEHVVPTPPPRRYGYALTHILADDVIRVSLPAYSHDGGCAAIYVEGSCSHDGCSAGGVFHLKRDGAEWRRVDDPDPCATRDPDTR